MLADNELKSLLMDNLSDIKYFCSYIDNKYTVLCMHFLSVISLFSYTFDSKIDKDIRPLIPINKCDWKKKDTQKFIP